MIRACVNGDFANVADPCGLQRPFPEPRSLTLRASERAANDDAVAILENEMRSAHHEPTNGREFCAAVSRNVRSLCSASTYV